MYSTSTDERRGRTRTLSNSKKTLTEEKKKVFQKGKVRPTHTKCELILKTRQKSPEEVRFEARQALTGMRKSLIADNFVRKMQAARGHKKGSIRSRRGTYDDDALVTARYQNLILDERCIPIGNGRFREGKPGEPGEFIPDGTDTFEPQDHGPVCMGDQWVKYGESKAPGTDIRRFDQMTYLENEKGPLTPDTDGWVRDPDGSNPSRQQGGWRRSEPSREGDIMNTVERGKQWMADSVPATTSSRKVFKKAK